MLDPLATSITLTFSGGIGCCNHAPASMESTARRKLAPQLLAGTRHLPDIAPILARCASADMSISGIEEGSSC